MDDPKVIAAEVASALTGEEFTPDDLRRLVDEHQRDLDLLEQMRLAAEDAAAHVRMVEAARSDPATFCEHVLRDERTGKAFTLAPMHEEWHRLIANRPRVVLWSHVDAGKTWQVSIGRVLWELGRDTSLRIAVISNTRGQAEKIIRTIARYIETSEELHEVFPGLLPGEPWTSTHLTLRRREIGGKDPSVQAFGVHGNILGSRVDLLVLDDVLDYENTRTEHMRRELWDWYHSTIVGRLTKGARAVAIGNSFHPADLLHQLVNRTGEWYGRRFPVLSADGSVSWPARWDLAWVDEKRREYGSREFARQMMCEATLEDDGVTFRRDWIDACLRRGDGVPLVRSAAQVAGLANGTGKKPRIVTGVDLGVGRQVKHDLSSLFTVAGMPDGTRRVLDCEAGRWHGSEIVRRIEDRLRTYGGEVWVEDNSAQAFLVQFAQRDLGPSVKGFTTGKDKLHPEYGIAGVATEFEREQWVVPSSGGRAASEDLAAWVGEMIAYDPGAHTGDRLMSAWIAREALRRAEQKKELVFL